MYINNSVGGTVPPDPLCRSISLLSLDKIPYNTQLALLKIEKEPPPPRNFRTAVLLANVQG